MLGAAGDAVVGVATPDWVSTGTVMAVVALLGVVGGAIAWVKVQVDRNEDRRAAEQRRLDELHRDDRSHWVERLGIPDMEREYRSTLAAVEVAHRAQLHEMQEAHLASVDEVRRDLGERLDRVTRATEVRGLRHRRWDERVRGDLIAMGGRDPGDPPPMYETDGELLGEWSEDPPPPAGADLPRRRTADEDTETA